MTWSDFNDEVRIYLSVHNRRQGIQNLIDQWIVAAVIDIQRFVEYFRGRHLNLLTSSDLVTNGYSQRGELPDGQVTGFRILKVDTDGNIIACNGGKIPAISWADAQRGICGTLAIDTLGAALHPAAHAFYLVPSLGSDEVLEIAWTGIKREFELTDVVLFEQICAQAVGEYVLARLSRLVDKDIPLAQSFDASYKALRRALYTEYQHRRFIADYDAKDVGMYGGVLLSGVSTGLSGDSFNEPRPSRAITTDDGAYITTEDGSVIITG